MAITVKFIGSLRQITGKAQLKIECADCFSLKDLILKISQDMPQVKASLIDQQAGALKTNALILINDREISVLNGLETKVKEGDIVVFVPVVHGG